jgi:histidinol-phosphate aminotransferase
MVRSFTIEQRSRMSSLLRETGLAVVPSEANFVLVETDEESALVQALAGHGVAVRPGSALGVPGTVRISVPSDAGMQLLRSALHRNRRQR